MERRRVQHLRSWLGFLVGLGFWCACPANIPTSERDALVAFYTATGGPSWTNRTNWLGNPGTEHTWFGVTLNSQKTTVIRLTLPLNNLTGSIPASLAGLPNLQVLNLTGNALTGAIPPELGTLGSLQELWLGYCQIAGSLPDQIGGLSSLRRLELPGNQLSGPLPAQVGSLANLAQLNASGNQISGPLPESLGNLAQLQVLNLTLNPLACPLPATFAQLSALQEAYLAETQLAGPVPQDIGNLKQLRVLELSSNALTGSIPDSAGSCAALESLSLGYNQLSGSLPPQLGNLASLTTLSVEHNALTGPLPSELGNLANLTELRAEFNQISGEIPDSFCGLARLQSLHLERNRIGGILPFAMGNMTALQEFWIFGNKVLFEIPAGITSLTNLRDRGGLALSYNGLYAASPAVKAFVDAKDLRADWLGTQTTPPAGVAVGSPTGDSLTVTWQPIPYGADPGGYIVRRQNPVSGGEDIVLRVPGKETASLKVTGLQPDTPYTFFVSAYTEPHANNDNEVEGWNADGVTGATVACAGLKVGTLQFCADQVQQVPNTNTYTLSGNVQVNGALFFDTPVTFTGNPASGTGTLTTEGSLLARSGAAWDTIMTGPGLLFQVDGAAGTLRPPEAGIAGQFVLTLAGAPCYYAGKPIEVTADRVILRPILYIGIKDVFTLASWEATLEYPKGQDKALTAARLVQGRIFPGLEFMDIAVTYDPAKDLLVGSAMVGFKFMMGPALRAQILFAYGCPDALDLTVSGLNVPLGLSGFALSGARFRVEGVCFPERFGIFLGGALKIPVVPAFIFDVQDIGCGYRTPYTLTANSGTVAILTKPVANLNGEISFDADAPSIFVRGSVALADVIGGGLALLYSAQDSRFEGLLLGDVQIPEFTCSWWNAPCRVLRATLLKTVGLPYQVHQTRMVATLARDENDLWNGRFISQVALPAGISLAVLATWADGAWDIQVGREIIEVPRRSPSGVGCGRTEAGRTATIPQGTPEACFAVARNAQTGTLPAITLSNPGGETITPQTAPDFPGVTYLDDEAGGVSLFWVSRPQAGDWTLSVQNLGEAEVTFLAQTSAPSPAPAFTSVELAGDAVTISASVTPTGAGTTLRFYRARDASGEMGAPVSDPLPVPLGTATATWDVSGLPTGDYFLYARADDGKNPPVTAAYPTPVAIRHGALEAPTHLTGSRSGGTVTLSWTPSPSPARLAYQVRYTDTPEVPGYKALHSASLENGTQVAGLAEDSKYRFTVAAFDEDGNFSPESNSITVGKAGGLPGDCDGGGTVSIGEVQKAINMFLGSIPPDCGVDCNGDGTISIGEVQKVINGFLGVAASC
jgi:Leucine-rich repeat (LRR) protein